MRKRIVITGLLVTVGVSLLFGGWPRVKRWQEARGLSLARTCLDRGDYREAALSLRQVLRANPASVPAVRLWVALLEQAGAAGALAWHRRLVELEPTTENRLSLVAAELREGRPPFPEAQRVLTGLQRKGETNSLTYHLVSAQLAIRLRTIPVAMAHLRAAIQLDPTNALHRVNLAVLELASTNAQTATAARETLASCVASDSPGLAALRALVQDAIDRADWPVAKARATELQRRRDADFGDMLRVLVPLHATLDPLLTNEVHRLERLADTNSVHVAQLMEAMLRLDLVEETAAWAAKLDAGVKATPEVSLAWADVLQRQEDWEALRTHLQAGRWGRLEWCRLALLARVQATLELSYASKGSWQQALRAGSGNLAALTGLARLTREWGWQHEHEEVLTAILNRFPGEKWAFLELENSFARSGRTRELNELYAQMRRLQPTNLVYRNNWALTSLLLRRQTNEAFRMAREVWDSDTNNLSFASTYAFALHLQGQPEKGLELLNRFPTNLLQRPALAPYLVALLRQVGRTNEARAAAERQDPSRLLPEEVALAKGRRQ